MVELADNVSTMAGIKVRAAWRPWRGSQSVPREDSLAAVITHFEINGHWVWAENAQLRTDGPFLLIDVAREPTEGMSYAAREQLEKVHASFEEGAWVEQNDIWITYQVADFEMRMLAPGEHALAEINS